jgi:RNA polymerase sigma-70 factor (ECF subfamily)
MSAGRSISLDVNVVNPKTDSEESLLDATMAGDKLAFAEMVNRHERRILRLAQKITRNQEDAEEVVQDSFMQVFAHLEGFQRNCKFSTWLTKIAINAALMKIRRRRSCDVSLDMLLNTDDRKAFQSVRCVAPTPEERCSSQEERELVGRMLEYIKPLYRYPLQLHLLQDLSYTEIACLMGISNAAAKSRIHRAKLDLRRVLDEFSNMRRAASRQPGSSHARQNSSH